MSELPPSKDAIRQQRFLTDFTAYVADSFDPVVIACLSSEATRTHFTTLVQLKHEKIKKKMPKRDKMALAVKRAKSEMAKNAKLILKSAALQLLGILPKLKVPAPTMPAPRKMICEPIDPKYRTNH